VQSNYWTTVNRDDIISVSCYASCARTVVFSMYAHSPRVRALCNGALMNLTQLCVSIVYQYFAYAFTREHPRLSHVSLWRSVRGCEAAATAATTTIPDDFYRLCIIQKHISWPHMLTPSSTVALKGDCRLFPFPLTLTPPQRHLAVFLDACSRVTTQPPCS